MTASLLATAVIAFAGTTIDDVIILTALFMARRAGGSPRAVAIIAGQYAGYAVILGMALLAATLVFRTFRDHGWWSRGDTPVAGL